MKDEGNAADDQENQNDGENSPACLGLYGRTEGHGAIGIAALCRHVEGVVAA
jgi:hypothetical protein